MNDSDCWFLILLTIFCWFVFAVPARVAETPSLCFAFLFLLDRTIDEKGLNDFFLRSIGLSLSDKSPSLLVSYFLLSLLNLALNSSLIC